MCRTTDISPFSNVEVVVYNVPGRSSTQGGEPSVNLFDGQGHMRSTFLGFCFGIGLNQVMMTLYG
jgi:hypothetical protein